MSRETLRAYVALGGNLGPVRKTLIGAIQVLDSGPGVRVTAASPLFRTPPVGGPGGQDPFLNAVAAVETSLPAATLLARLHEIEASFGRERTVHWGPRTLDLDLLLYGPDFVIDAPPRLVVPHPRMTERAFVLSPLVCLAPALVVPGTGLTVAAHLAALPAEAHEGVEVIAEWWRGPC